MKLNWVLKEGLVFAKREEWGEEEEREGGSMCGMDMSFMWSNMRVCELHRFGWKSQ